VAENKNVYRTKLVMLQKEKILIVNPYGIGDLLFATPLFNTIKKANPHSELHVLVGSRTKEILDSNKDVDNIIVDDRDFWRGKKNGALRRLLYLLKLRKNKYDTFMNLSLDVEYNFIATYLLNIPCRIGFNFKGRGRCLNRKLPLPHGFYKNHVAQYYVQLLSLWKKNISSVESPTYHFPLGNIKLQEKIFELFRDGESKLISIFPGGGASWGARAHWKMWPVEKFAQLADMIIQNTGAQVIVMGSPEEKELCDTMLTSMKEKAISLAGEIKSLAEVGLFLKNMNFVICNDSGIFHVSLSQSVPTLGIFGPVDETVYGSPKNTPHVLCVTSKIACRPCYYKFSLPECREPSCLIDLSVGDVYSNFKSLYEKKPLCQ